MTEFTDEELFFGADESGQPPQAQPKTQDPYLIIRTGLSDIERRLRVLEERYANLRKKIQITDQNMLDHEGHISKEIKIMNTTTTGLKFQVQEIGEKLSLFNSEFQNLAKKRDLQVVEKYLDMWQPMSFVTRKELQEAIKKT